MLTVKEVSDPLKTMRSIKETLGKDVRDVGPVKDQSSMCKEER